MVILRQIFSLKKIAIKYAHYTIFSIKSQWNYTRFCVKMEFSSQYIVRKEKFTKRTGGSKSYIFQGVLGPFSLINHILQKSVFVHIAKTPRFFVKKWQNIAF